MKKIFSRIMMLATMMAAMTTFSQVVRRKTTTSPSSCAMATGKAMWAPTTATAGASVAVHTLR